MCHQAGFAPFGEAEVDGVVHGPTTVATGGGLCLMPRPAADLHLTASSRPLHHSRQVTVLRCCRYRDHDRSPVLARLLDSMRAIAPTLERDGRLVKSASDLGGRAFKGRPLDTDHLEVRSRSGSVATAAVLAVTTVVLSWTAPADACSIGRTVFPQVYLDELDDMDVVAIGQPEVVARTGPARGWHRAGVIAFTSAWLVSGNAEAVAETVWTKNNGRHEDEDGFCTFRFVFDVDTVGTRQGFHVLTTEGSVVPLALAPSPDAGSLDPASIDPAFLNDRYGPPVEITPDPGLVTAAFAPLAAERRADDITLQATLASAIVVLGLALAVARTRRSPTRQPPELAFGRADAARE